MQAGPAATRTPSQRPLCSYWLSAPTPPFPARTRASPSGPAASSASPQGGRRGAVSPHWPTWLPDTPSSTTPLRPRDTPRDLGPLDPQVVEAACASQTRGPLPTRQLGRAQALAAPAPAAPPVCPSVLLPAPGSQTSLPERAPTPHDGPEPLGPAQLCDPRTASRTTRSRPAHPPPALRPDQAQGRPRDAFPGWRLCHSFTTKNHLLRFLLTLRDPDVSRGISARVLHHHPGAGAGGPDGGRGRHSPVDLLT